MAASQMITLSYLGLHHYRPDSRRRISCLSLSFPPVIMSESSEDEYYDGVLKYWSKTQKRMVHGAVSSHSQVRTISH